MVVFNSDNVIKEHISNADLRAYFVGFDYGKYKYDPLVEKIMSAIVDFSLGFHEGVLNSYTIKEIRKAACMVYKIEQYNPQNADHEKYSDENDFYNKKYANRGEFGELILHLLLRDFLKTQPLVSKIFAKDSQGVPAHGFDSVHIGNSLIDNTKKSLYLGESKLKINGNDGIEELLDDIKKHFVKDFLTTPAGEFVLIGNKKKNFIPIEEYKDLNTKNEYEKFIKEKNYWFEKIDGLQNGDSLQDLFDSITVPLLCTYESAIFINHNDESTEKFKKEYEEEVGKLKVKLDKGLSNIREEYKDSGEPISTNLNIVLMLFPIPSKKELVKKLHTKLYHQQNL